MFWRIIIGIALNLLSAVLLRPKSSGRGANVSDFSIPRADEGAKVFDFAGTAWTKDPIVAWYGDFRSRSRGREGFEYFLGFHLVLARQLGALLAITMSEKDAWRGQLSSGRGSINKRQLFGGIRREGGFIGEFDLLDGNPSQPVNDYLDGQLGELTPAYRGVASLVFRKPFVGANSARLPGMKFKIFNVEGIHRGWLPDKSIIGVTMEGGGASVYIALDTSPSMGIGSRFPTAKTALAGFVRSLKGSPSTSVRVVTFSEVVTGSIERFDCTDAELEEIADWIEALSSLVSGTDFGVAVASAPAFFTADLALEREVRSDFLLSSSSEARRKMVIFVTDGEPAPTSSADDAVATLGSISGVEVFAFNIDLTDTTYTEMLDNTPGDGVPVVTGANPSALTAALSGAFVGWADMNPAHIIRCLWTDPMRGGVAQDSEIGDSFADAADLFVAEKFGLSVPFRGADLVESDRLEVERHVDAVSYRSRRTGKIEIKPIRNDYVIDDLPVLDSSVVLEWSGLERSNRGELPNQLTVIYTKRKNGDTASVTRTNVAGVRRAGRVIPGEAINYPFITRRGLATRVCLRDLSVQDRPLLTGTLRLAYLPPELEIGEPFILNEPLLGVSNVVVRILESQEGDGRDNSVTVRVSEDRYTLSAEDTLGEEVDDPEPVSSLPEPSPFRVVQEAPYYLMVQASTQADVDARLTAEPDLGIVLATGTKATAAHQDITVAVDSGAGYVADGDVDFSPSALTLSALTSEADDVVVTIPASTDLDTITANSLALIGTELVRIDSFTDNAGNIDIALGRGCLDTVPVEHAIGARIFFLGDAIPSQTQYLSTDSVDVKLLTKLVSEELSLAAADIDAVNFDSRAIRPYPPGQFKLDGSYEQNQSSATYVFTWAHRDRLAQVGTIPEDHDDASIGPEAGVTYRFRLEAFDDLGGLISTMVDTNVGSLLTYIWDGVTPAIPSGTASLVASVTSVRGGYESWQRPRLSLSLFLPPADLTFEVL